MFLAIPYQPTADFPGLARAILKAGTNPGHTLAIVSLRDHDGEALKFTDALADYFGRIAKVTVDGEGGMTANRFFTAALNAYARWQPGPGEAPTAPMMYLPPDHHPRRPRWLDELQADYFRQGAPRVMANFQGSDPPRPDGPVILSRDFRDSSALLRFLPPNSHWRDYLAWEMARNSVNAGGIGSHTTALLAPTFEV